MLTPYFHIYGMTLLINKSDTIAYILSCSLKMLNWAPSEWVSLIFSIIAKGIANNNNILNTVKIGLQVSIFLSFLYYPSTNSFIHSPIKELCIWCYNNTFILHGKKWRWYSIIYKTLNLKFSACRILPISALRFKDSETYKMLPRQRRTIFIVRFSD